MMAQPDLQLVLSLLTAVLSAQHKLETLSLLGLKMLSFMCETLDQATSQETTPFFDTDSHNQLGQLM